MICAPLRTHEETWNWLDARRRLVDQGWSFGGEGPSAGLFDEYEVAAAEGGMWSEAALSLMEQLCQPRRPSAVATDERLPSTQEMTSSVTEAMKQRGTAASLQAHRFFTREGCSDDSAMQKLTTVSEWIALLPVDEPLSLQDYDSSTNTSWTTAGTGTL